MKKVIILGGGYAGLAAALRLGEHGVRSTLLEAAPVLGGLGGCFTVGGYRLEKAYHHIKPEDQFLLDLIAKVGLADELNWVDTRMAFYVGGRFYSFSTPLDLLRFRPFNGWNKLVFGLGALRARWIDGRSLEGLSAKEWVIGHWNQEIYDIMMEPMLLNKFGIPPDKISAGFLHGRVKGLSSAKKDPRKGEVLAYLRGSTERLSERLAELVCHHADVRVRSPVDRLEADEAGFRVWSRGQVLTADYVVNTLPLNTFERMQKNFQFKSHIDYQGVICVAFFIKEPLTPFYWINIMDPDISFRVIVNQTLLDDYKGTMIYCGTYLSPSTDLFKKSDDEICELFERDLRRLFSTMSILDRRVFRTGHATPIFDLCYGQKMHALQNLSPRMFFAGNAMIYPGSRTLSSILGTGYHAADRLLKHSS